jgi:ring-1,2-phenylacetyl-CoA epoxidase subunit PaaD
MDNFTSDQIWGILNEIRDPEIPIVSIVDLGMVRSIYIEGQDVYVSFAPTFVGCPALDVIQSEIKGRLSQSGANKVEITLCYSPPWSSNWISPSAREKLREFGLAPPPYLSGDIELALSAPVICPHCSSDNTIMTNDYGSTLCRAIYVCKNCSQPFEQFKPI